MSQFKISSILQAVLMITLVTFITAEGQTSGEKLYSQYCAACHGADLQGGSGSSFVDEQWKFGSDRGEIVKNIKNGIQDQGMPAFGTSLSDQQVEIITDHILNVAAGEASAEGSKLDTLQTLDYKLNVETFAEGLEIPWAIDFVNENTALITERPGRLRRVIDGELQPNPVSGIPEVLHEGQGGLMDVTADPDFEQNGWIYLSYSHALDAGEDDPPAMTRIIRGRINDNNWVDQEILFEAPHETYRTTRHHYGNQIVFDSEGYLYFSIGDRGGREHAQQLSRPNGKVHRIYPDGSIPKDNPFENHENALPSVFTYGHRNPQGLAVHPETDQVWDAEHGPRGGDELNLLVAAKNYGWPEITYGINYSGSILTRDREKEGLEQPNLYWRPSIAVSGISFYDGSMFPYWSSRLLVGALAYQEVKLLNIKQDRVIHQEVILKDRGRVRDVITGPDGAIYVVLNKPGQVLRLSKLKESLQ